MTQTRHLVVVMATLLLSACGSSPVIDDHYYSLVLSASEGAAPRDVEAAPVTLVIDSVQLPAYLERRGMPMQVGPNEIKTANHHFWAEPLDEAIAKVLASDIEAHLDGVAVERDAGRHSPAGDCRLRVEIDAFQPTNDARVVARGRFWIATGNTSSRHNFSFSRSLTVDGYAHAVDRLRETLRSLAEQISEVAGPVCAGDSA